MRQFHTTCDKRLFDFEDFYSRIAQSLPNNAVIAEVGVANGTSAIFLAEALLNLGKTFKLHLIDNLAYGGNHQLNDIVQNIQRADIAEWVEIVAMDSLNASCRFPDNHFDFVFIDASHRYELTKADIRLWYYKIKDCGILAGHDYNRGEGQEVQYAVDEVIPPSYLTIEPTAKELGVWWVKKQYDLVLN